MQILFFLQVALLIYVLIDVLFLHRALGNEFDDFNSKSCEAEKEVNMLQMKIEEVNNNLSKLNKDMDCKNLVSLLY